MLSVNAITKITLVFALFAMNVQAQDIRSLIAEGNELHNARNYTGAIEKYKAALSLEPGNISAAYQLAFSLNAAGKGTEALPWLQKVTESGAQAAIVSSSYALMAGIYDKSAQPQKAIESYARAIQLDSANAALHYGLGLAYFRVRRYAEAEASAVAAIKADRDMADAFRLYGLVTFHQDKRAPALLGLCHYLWLEPKGSRSTEAYGNIQSILKGGALKEESGVKPPRPDAETVALNQVVTNAAVAGSKGYAVKADLFGSQLRSVFQATGALAGKQSGDAFFRDELAAFYYNLGQSPHVKAFACVIGQSSDKSAVSWLSAHPQEVAALNAWMKGPTR